MKKIILLLAVTALLSACICKPVVGGLPEGEKVKINIDDKTFKGELLSVTPELLIIRFYDEQKKKDILLGFPVPQTDLCKVKKGCGPIVGLLSKDKKYSFKGKSLEKINENLVNLSPDARYASKVPDWVKEQLKLYNQQ